MADVGLEYWNYLDRPETFIRLAILVDQMSLKLKTLCSIGDSDDELGRMLAVLRFWFTKDLVRSGGNANGRMTESRNRNM